MPEQQIDTAGIVPRRLVEAMEAAGWTRAGGIPNVYVRLTAPPRWPGDRTRLLVPLNPEMADYRDDLDAIVAMLADHAAAGIRANAVLNQLTGGDDEHA